MGQANTPYIEYVEYICFKISFVYILKLKVDKVMFIDTYSVRLWNLAPLNINSTLKRHNVDKLYDKFPHRNVILYTFSKLNTIKGEYSFNKC